MRGRSVRECVREINIKSRSYVKRGAERGREFGHTPHQLACDSELKNALARSMKQTCGCLNFDLQNIIYIYIYIYE